MDPIDNIFHIFEELVIGTRMPSTVRWLPKTDIFLIEEDLVIEIELPGVEKEDISVSIGRKGLYIEGVRRRSAQTSKKISFYNLEIDYGPFERQIYFPCEVDPNRMKASLKHGLLIIEFKRIFPIEHEIPIEEE